MRTLNLTPIVSALTVAPAEQAASIEKCLKSLLTVLLQVQTKQYETRKKEITPPACAAYVHEAADLGLVSTQISTELSTELSTESYKELSREYANAPVLLCRLDSRHCCDTMHEALTRAKLLCIELPVSSQSHSVAYLVMQSSMDNRNYHSKALAFHAADILEQVLRAKSKGHKQITVGFIVDNQVSAARFASLEISDTLIDMLEHSVHSAQSFVPPTEQAVLLRAKDKALRYGEEPALFLPYEVRPVGSGLRLELRFALIQQMFNQARTCQAIG